MTPRFRCSWPCQDGAPHARLAPALVTCLLGVIVSGRDAAALPLELSGEMGGIAEVAELADLPFGLPVGGDETPGHRLSVYTAFGGAAYSSPGQTIAGAGGWVGVRRLLGGPHFIQADIGGLALMGGALEARVGAGIQASGWWSPAIVLTFGLLAGGRMAFVTPERPQPPRGPALAFGLEFSPLRYSLDRGTVSVLTLGIGAGADEAGPALAFHLGLLETAFEL